MIARESARLRKVFERILIASAATSGALCAYACSSNSSSQAFGGKDASATSDSSSGSSSGGENEAAADQSSPQGDGQSAGGDAGSDSSTSCQPGTPTEWDAGADISITCVYRVALPCGLPPSVTMISQPNCVLTLGECSKFCTGAAAGYVNCEITNGLGCDDDAMAYVAADGEAISIDCNHCNGVGRRPAGLARPRGRRAATALGGYFASAAHLEAASVHAFERMAEELAAHGAPRSLVRAARRSARDEVRHARVTSRIARRFGGEPAAVRVRSRGVRRLRDMALENAVEGCVRETYGALVATWQASHAQDAGIRRAMDRIAQDETRHAALSWAVARAIDPMLDDRDRRRVAAARARAVRTLRREVAAVTHPDLVREAGVPDASSALRLVDELAAAVW